MRILFLSHRLPYAPNRGDRARAFHLLRLLASRHEVHLVSLVHDHSEQRRIPEMTSIVASARGALVPRLRNRVSALASLGGDRPLTHTLLASADFNHAIRQCVDEAPPDVVLAFCTGIGESVLRPPLQDIPCVLDMVDVDSEKWAELGNSHRGPMKWIYRREARLLRAFEQRIARHATVVAVVSARERDIAEQRAGLSNVAVVECGLSSSPADVPTNPQNSVVVFTGVFNYEPNEQGARWFAEEVWPLVKQQEREAVLMLVGMNPSRRVRALAQPGSIHVTGAVPDVKPYLSQAAVAIAPLWLSRGTQTKVLDALAAGLPCVVTPAVLEGLPHAARRACISRGDAAGFADAVVTLLRKPADAEQRAAIRASVASLGWEEQLAPFLDFVEDAREAGSRTV